MVAIHLYNEMLGAIPNFGGGAAVAVDVYKRQVPLGEVRELFRELFRQFALAKGENYEWTFGEWVFDRLLSGETEP